MADFFISYTQADRPWAEWIDCILRDAGYTTKIQAWDFRPGQNFVVEMHRASAGSHRMIAVLSPDYLRSLYAMAEWAAAFAADPDGSKGKLVPVLVREAEIIGLLAAIIQIRLVGLHEAAAREELLKGLVPGLARPENVRFPGAHLFPGPGTPAPDPEAAQAALSALPLDEVPEPGPLPVGSRMPLAANPLFVGREEDLKTLARQLRAKETAAVGQTAAASGLGGIGKTQLASEFVHRYGRFFKGGVFWMSFADAGAVPVEVAACGSSLGLHLSFETLTLDQQVRLVEEAWKSPLPRLLVFDNCEEEELLRRWRPPFGGSRVLVTSRRSEWDPALGVTTVPLTTLARPASLELLRRFRPDLSESEPALAGIAAELGDLPLALHLAGSFLRAYRSSSYGEPATYLVSLRQTDLLTHPSLEGRGSGLLPTGHDAHVGRTFALSFERLDPASPTDALATDLLTRAAWFAPGEPIPRSLLLKTVRANSGDLTAELDAEDALGRLTDLGLVESNHQRNLLMHRLVAAWARGLAEDDQPGAAVEEALLAEATKLNEARNPAPLMAWQPHLRSVAERAARRRDRTAARLCEELGHHLLLAGDYPRGRAYLEEGVALHEKLLGQEHPDTAYGLNILGRLLQKQGDFPGARLHYERSLGILEKILGPEHIMTAQSLNDLGSLLSDQGDYVGARFCYTRALAIRQEVLGPEDPVTAISLANLGSLLEAQGDYEGARTYFERGLAIRARVLGQEHPDTATNLRSLGSLFQAQGDYGRARQHFERGLSILENVLGPEHPDTAANLIYLGSLLQAQGDYVGARTYFECSLAILEKVLGPEHPDTARSLNYLGGLLQAQGDYEGARPYFDRSLGIVDRVLGPEHPNTATSLNNLGSLLQAQGDYGGAQLYYERSLTIVEKVLGLEHPSTATSLNNLGLLFQAQGDYEGARQYFERGLVIVEKVLGPEHPNTATSLNNLGFVLKLQGDFRGARPLLERAVAIQEKILGAEHPAIAVSLSNLAGLLQEQGDLRSARSYLERALVIQEKMLGAEHPDTAKGLLNFGTLCANQGNFAKARWYLERAFPILKARLGQDHPDTKEARWRLSLLPGARPTKKPDKKKH